MLLSINQLSELTGKDRRTITKQVEGLPHKDGEKRAHLYESAEALQRIYSAGSLEAARAEQARTQADLNRIRQQDIERKRVPIEAVEQTMNEIFGAIGSTLKASEGQALTKEKINELFEAFRDAPERLKW
jgi:hypothetical protein